MTIASPATITSTPLRPAASAAKSADPPKPRVKHRDEAAFRAFVDANQHLFADYVARRLSGPHAGAAEDALQEGLIDIWNEWDEWPRDEKERIRFARHALRTAALLAVRRRTGRDDSPRAGEIVVDFSDIDGATRPSPAAEGLARDLGRAIAEQSMVKDQLAYIEKASLVAAIATLTDLEQRVLFMTAQGDDCKEIAEDLGVTHQQAREALMRARRLCRMLIEHADGEKVSEKEATMLWQYRDGALSGKRARELKRHVDHCTACQRLIGLEDSISTNGALVILPIPVLLLAAGHAATTTATSGAATGAGSASAHTTIGGSILSPVAPAGWTGSVLATVAAKVGLALAGLAVTVSVAGVYKLAHDRRHSSAVALTVIRPVHEVAVEQRTTINPPRPFRPAAPKRHPAARTTHSHRASTRTTPRAARSRGTTRLPSLQSPIRGASASSSRPIVRNPTATTASRPHTTTSSGREFILGAD
jgi:RNA polymerase sigma factor (sigma-70 family)